MNASEARDKSRRVKQDLDLQRISIWTSKFFDAIEIRSSGGYFDARVPYENILGADPDEQVITSLIGAFESKGYKVNTYYAEPNYFGIFW